MISQELLDQARKGQREAMEGVMRQCYPRVYRMAYGLSGREDVGRGIVKFVFSQGLKAMEGWHVEGDAERWFFHHTVLTARRGARYQPDSNNDVLVKVVIEPTTEYRAFVRAVRQLPMQQREAFVLHYGEEFDTRQLGIAMDCSQGAAANHLEAARRQMRAVAGERFDFLSDAAGRAYAALEPQEKLVLQNIRRHARRHQWRRWARLGVKVLIPLAVLVPLAWAAWWVWRHYDF